MQSSEFMIASKLPVKLEKNFNDRQTILKMTSGMQDGCLTALVYMLNGQMATLR